MGRGGEGGRGWRGLTNCNFLADLSWQYTKLLVYTHTYLLTVSKHTGSGGYQRGQWYMALEEATQKHQYQLCLPILTKP